MNGRGGDYKEVVISYYQNETEQLQNKSVIKGDMLKMPIIDPECYYLLRKLFS
ncbi:hypothetical protein [Autumnicola psychrophila]|uniref:Uncharacterized protein n=1 Tax=Autumnicola psychrophila TaxID=3075592 RepID=A0ABU3DT73_9FLAO|nr:hypothetical protein [Zunongwangia sp. F225]MDT0686912.1 hypothetical protein [Zunongwangia sp. F225]